MGIVCMHYAEYQGILTMASQKRKHTTALLWLTINYRFIPYLLIDIQMLIKWFHGQWLFVQGGERIDIDGAFVRVEIVHSDFAIPCKNDKA